MKHMFNIVSARIVGLWEEVIEIFNTCINYVSSREAYILYVVSNYRDLVNHIHSLKKKLMTFGDVGQIIY